MARIGFGLATSHGPMLSIGPEYWSDRVPFDRKNPRHFYQGHTYTFPELVELRASEGIEEQITPEVCRERYDRCQSAIRTLGDLFEAGQADAAVVVGNDQMEVFHPDHVPGLAVFWGEFVEGHKRTEEFLAKLDPAVARAELDRTPPEDTRYACLPDLGRHMIEGVVAEGFDVAQLTRLTTGEIGVNSAPHAYGFVYRRVMRDRVPPHVPVFVNTFYPPNQPPVRRCFEFGRALARAVASWGEDRKVAVIASGGLSHFVIDEGFDRRVLDALAAADVDALSAMPEAWFQSGTSEIKNWITVAGAAAEAGLRMRLIDYVPCYRSEAGTGSAMGFAEWQ